MKILIITQALDLDDSTLSAYHDWLKAVAQPFERATVVCLKKGRHAYPSEIPVLSLGKEEGAGRFTYIARLFFYIIGRRRDYDAVFVHMNQEYVVLAGWLWRLMGKRVYLWRNHYAGNFLTDVAALFCTKIFCTSKYSYTAKYAKTSLMPVGIDTSHFALMSGSVRIPKSVLFIARMAPSKRPELLLEALQQLVQRGIPVQASLYGSPSEGDRPYYEHLKTLAASLKVDAKFHLGVPNQETPALYNAYELFVNCSPSGMYDKTLFEAAFCGALPIASSQDYGEAIPELYFDGSAHSLAESIERVLAAPPLERERLKKKVSAFAEPHSLRALSAKLRLMLDC